MADPAGNDVFFLFGRDFTAMGMGEAGGPDHGLALLGRYGVILVQEIGAAAFLDVIQESLEGEHAMA